MTLIVSHKLYPKDSPLSNYELALVGIKTETRRLKSPNIYGGSTRQYIFKPARTGRGWWLPTSDYSAPILDNPYRSRLGIFNEQVYENPQYVETQRADYVQCKFDVTAIRWDYDSSFKRGEPLGAMTEQDAWAEGCESLADYRALWEQINGAWDDNQHVCVITFRSLQSKLYRHWLRANEPAKFKWVGSWESNHVSTTT